MIVMRSGFDAAVLLVADGLVAAGRVLGGFRRRSGWERQADRLAVAEESREVWEPDELWVPDGPSAFVWPESVGPKHGLTCRSCEGDIATCGCWDDDADESNPVRSAAVSRPAADNTTEVDHLEAAWNYHQGAVGYAAMRAGGVEWFCEGCNWHGPTKQAHARHRFQVLADMKNATERIQEQLAESTNACVVDGCDFWWHTYEQLNSHSRQMHLEPNPLPAGGFRYPGADHVGDFTWHHVPTHRIQEQLGGAS